MFQSSILDVASGVIFTFLAVSLATSIIVEAIASMLKWRSGTLLKGVQDLVNDKSFSGLAQELYAHALVNPRGPGGTSPKANQPAYIQPHAFAAALLDVLDLTDKLAPHGAADVAALRQAIAADAKLQANPQIRILVDGAVLRGLGDLHKVKTEIADWFDNAMDRVSGAYKRWTQLVGLVIALVLCLALNIDTLHVARTFWADPAILREFNIDAFAQRAGGQIAGAAAPGAAAPAGVAPAVTPPDAASAVDMLVKRFPVGWPAGFLTTETPTSGAKPIPGFTAGNYWQWLVGCFITALATLFGASSWFDVLQSVVRLKGAGPSPADKQKGRAAPQ